jgi:hypothetical protein
MRLLSTLSTVHEIVAVASESDGKPARHDIIHRNNRKALLNVVTGDVPTYSGTTPTIIKD